MALGSGKDVDTAQEEIGQVVEGYRNTKEVWLLSERMGVEMPIEQILSSVVSKEKTRTWLRKIYLLEIRSQKDNMSRCGMRVIEMRKE
ncbi:hypothetical protein OH492_00035 [Vibrio chagasii]|nr:hypothetical protein [Vibrio chagasii]